MCKTILYGVELDTEGLNAPRKIRNSVTLATVKAFSAVMQAGRFQKSQLDIVVNEVVRGRLSPTDTDGIRDLATTVSRIRMNGIDTKDIAILRSLYFEFDEIMEFAKEHKRVDEIIREQGIEDPEIEAIYGLTTPKLSVWYVSYKEARGFQVC